MTPQAMRAPELPAGSVLPSSGPAWMTMAVPSGFKSELGEGALPVGADGEVRQVAGVVTFGALEAVLLVRGIEVRAGALELGSLTLAGSVDVDAVLAGGQALHLDGELHHAPRAGEGGRTDLLALGVLQRGARGRDVGGERAAGKAEAEDGGGERRAHEDDSSMG